MPIGYIKSTFKIGRNLDLDLRNGLALYYGSADGDGGGVITQAFGIGIMYNFTR